LMVTTTIIGQKKYRRILTTELKLKYESLNEA